MQVVGNNAPANYKIAQRLRQQVAAIPGAADVHIHQVYEQPQLNLDVDRVKAGQVLCIIEAMKMMNQIESDRAGWQRRRELTGVGEAD